MHKCFKSHLNRLAVTLCTFAATTRITKRQYYIYITSVQQQPAAYTPALLYHCDTTNAMQLTTSMSTTSVYDNSPPAYCECQPATLKILAVVCFCSLSLQLVGMQHRVAQKLKSKQSSICVASLKFVLVVFAFLVFVIAAAYAINLLPSRRAATAGESFHSIQK